MDNNEIQMLIDLRSYIISAHNLLDGHTSKSAAIVRQRDVAFIYENCIRKIEHILGDNVKIK